MNKADAFDVYAYWEGLAEMLVWLGKREPDEDAIMFFLDLYAHLYVHPYLP